jgi:hypothetical protein
MADRVFYENEAFLRWQVLKDELPTAIYKDIVSERQELRIFLAVDSAYEVILFSLNEDMTARNACLLMKTRFETDFVRIDDGDMVRVWNFYECDKFVAEGENNEAVTATYNLGMAWGEGFKQE